MFRKTIMLAALAVVLASLFLSSPGPASADKTAEAAIAKAMVTMKNLKDAKKVEFGWGWIRWLMNSKVDKKATMTFGIVKIDAGKSNPLHMHPNCEEYLYVLSGECDHVLGKETVRMKQGDVIRIPQSVPHKAKAVGKDPVMAVIVYNSGERKIVILEEGGEE